MHSAHMRPQHVRMPERSVALRARVVSALLVYRAHMPAQVVRCPERSVALRARLVSALLVHRALMLPQIADVPGLVVALRARVSARLSKLFHHPVAVAGEEVHSILSRATRKAPLRKWIACHMFGSGGFAGCTVAFARRIRCDLAIVH